MTEEAGMLVNKIEEYTPRQLERLAYWLGELSTALGTPCLEFNSAEETIETALLKVACERIGRPGHVPAPQDTDGVPFEDRLHSSDFSDGFNKDHGFAFGLASAPSALRKLADIIERRAAFAQRAVIEQVADAEDFGMTTLHLTYHERVRPLAAPKEVGHGG